VPALDRLAGLRVVGDPAALDGATWQGDGDILVLRFAPDEIFAAGATHVVVADDHAIIEPEAGFVGARLGPDDWHGLLHRIEWRLPNVRPALAQGSIAGIPAKFWLTDGDGSVVVVAAVHAPVLAERLGWSR
jgi:hypothetical protein